MNIEKFQNKKFQIVDGSYVSCDKWEERIVESYYSNGYASFSDSGFIIIESEDLKLEIDFDIYVSGNVDYDPGDYFNPPETFVEIINEELSVNSVYVEDVLIDIGDDVKSYLSKVIKNMI